MADGLTPKLILIGAREAIDGGMEHIEDQVLALEDAVATNPGLAFDLAKTVIESVCKAVLDEREIPWKREDDLPRLFKAATQALPFLPPELSDQAEIRKSLAQTLNGLHTALQGICELRNQCGFASHGSGSVRPAMEAVQALLAAGAADAIVGFLNRVHRQDRARAEEPRLGYETNAEFNGWIDELHDPVDILGEEFQPSRILFEMAPRPYRTYLGEFNLQSALEAIDDEDRATDDRP